MAGTTPPREILEAIAAAPEADAPRLAYVQWLEANGHAERAEHLKLSLQIEAMPPNSPVRSQISRRISELQYRHQKAWLAELPQLDGVRWAMQRGLYEEVVFDSFTAFDRHHEEAFKHFVRQVSFNNLRSPQRLFRSEGLAHVRQLSLSYLNLNTEALTLLAQCPHLGKLQALFLPVGALQDEALAAITEAPWLSGLRRLCFRGSYGVRGTVRRSGLTAFARSPGLANLEFLSLASVGLGDEGMAAILDAPTWSRLRVLEVRSNNIGPEGLAPLLEGEGLPLLERLQIDRNRVGPEGTRRLARLTGLRWLHLGTNLIGNAGAEALAAPGAFTGLRFLDVSGNGIGDVGAAALAGADNLENLEALEVGGNLIGDGGMCEFGQTTALPRLSVFSGENNPAQRDLSLEVAVRFTTKGPPLVRKAAPPPPTPAPAARPLVRVGDADEDGLLEAIVSNPEDDLPRMVYADWLEEQGETERAELIRFGPPATPTQPEYTALVKRVTPAIPEEFAKSIHRMTFHLGLLAAVVQMRGLLTKAFQERGGPWLRSVRTFKLTIVGTTKNWGKVAVMPLLGHLRNLDVSGCGLGKEGLAALAPSPHFKGLYAINLSNNRLSRAEAIKPLVDANTLPRLVNLDLSGNWLNMEGVRYLLNWPQMAHLTALNLLGNWIHSGGVALIAESPALGNLTHLNLSHNYLHDQAIQAIVQSSALPKLTHLGMAGNNLSDAAAHALAGWPRLGQLKRLELQRNAISLDGVLAIARSPHLGAETKVCLSRYPYNATAQQQLNEALGKRLVWGW
jgi:uncharacterized protein (TIGR02996 family)